MQTVTDRLAGWLADAIKMAVASASSAAAVSRPLMTMTVLAKGPLRFHLAVTAKEWRNST